MLQSQSVIGAQRPPLQQGLFELVTNPPSVLWRDALQRATIDRAAQRQAHHKEKKRKKKKRQAPLINIGFEYRVRPKSAHGQSRG